jgi:L-ascorbate metabolism protein UlaG (beta-lactamase superfamily)
VSQRFPSVVATRGRDLLKWSWQRARAGPPRAPVLALRGVTPDLAFVHANRSAPAYTWIGHSSALLQVAGANLLLDPVFSATASPFRYIGPRRHQPPGLTLEELPHVDAVLLSHNHYDHLDRRSVRAVAAQQGGAPRYFVPRGTERWFARNLPRVRGTLPHIDGVDWDATRTVEAPCGPLTLHFLPVQHWSSRTGFDRNASLWGSWAVLHADFRFWYSGDLGYSHEPRRIGDRLGPFDAAAIAIGAYEPRWFMRSQHVNPEEAVQVMLDVQARQAIGVHWGTFALTDEPLDQPPRDLAVALDARGLPRERFIVLRHGETLRFNRMRSAAPDTPAAAGSPSGASRATTQTRGRSA